MINKSLSMKSARKYLFLLFTTYRLHAQNKEMSEIMQSSCSLFSSNILHLKQTVEQQYSEIKTILDGQANERMLTIRQQNQEEEQLEKREDPIIRSLNKSISDIIYVDKRVKDTIDMYKQQLKRLATDVYKWEKKNKELRSKLKKQSLGGEQNAARQSESNPNLLTNNNQLPANGKIEDKKLWDGLNKKIEQLKKNLKLYEDQIKEKDAEIGKLKSQISENNQSSKELKATKRNLTTIRGEKSLMMTQFQNLRKLLVNKQQILDIQNEQNQKFKWQIQHLNKVVTQNKLKIQALTIQNNALIDKNAILSHQHAKIQQLSATYTSQFPKQQFQLLKKQNTQLSMQISQLKTKSQDLTKELCDIQQSYEEVLIKERKKSSQIQKILADKNQTIYRLKNTQAENKYEYYVELVKLLTKKVMDRDEIIEKLREG